MLVPFRPCPYGVQRDHVGKVERRDRRLADIGIGVSRQAAKPCVNRVDGLGHGGEVTALNDLLDQAQLLLRHARVGIPNGDGGRNIGHACHVRPKLLQRHVGVERLVGGVGVHEGGCLVGHHFLEDRGDGLALGEPLPPDFGQQPGRLRLVHEDGAGGPAIGKGKPVQFIQNPRRRRGRESHDGQDTQMCVSKARLQPAGEGLIGQKRVEVHRHFRHADAMPVGRYGGMEIGQRAGIIEPAALRHEAVEQGQHAVGAVDEAAQQLPWVHACVVPALIEPGLRSGCFLGRRQPEKGQEIFRHEMRPGFLERCLALGIDQGGRWIGKDAVGVGLSFMALRLDEDRPAGAEAAQGVVDAPDYGDQFGRNG